MTQPYDPNQPPHTGQWQQQPYPPPQWQQYPPQYPTQGYGYPGYPMPPQRPRQSGLSVAGMVLGIVSLALGLLPVGFLPAITALVGLPLACVGHTRDNRSGAPTGVATAGMACSSIALVVWLVAIVYWYST